MVRSFKFETALVAEAPVDRCWAVLSDPKAHRTQWESGCSRAELVGKSGHIIVVELERKLPSGETIKQKLKGALRPVGRIDWSVEEGYEKGSKYWDVLQPVGDENKTRLVFSGDVVPQDRALKLRAAVSRNAAAKKYAQTRRKDLEALKTYVEKLGPLGQGEGWAYINLE